METFYWGQIHLTLSKCTKRERGKGYRNHNIFSPENNHYIITVSTMGLAYQQILSSLFSKDFTEWIKVEEQKKGTGLGLSIVKQPEAHSGNITVSSTPGIITSFKIQLPKDQDSYNKNEERIVRTDPALYFSSERENLGIFCAASRNAYLSYTLHATHVSFVELFNIY